jgi:hypothetical protein
MTLLGVTAAGFLIWLSSTVGNLGEDGDRTTGEFWATVGLWAATGLVMALSQLLGGWTKWGWPRVTGNVLLFGFLPALIVGGWIVAAGEPGSAWLGDHVRNWSDDIGVNGFVDDMLLSLPAIAFGIGLVFGFTFDTTGPRVRRRAEPGRPAVAPPPAETTQPEDERRVHIHEGDGDGDRTPATRPEPTTRSGSLPEE